MTPLNPSPEEIRNVALRLVETLNATVIPVRRDKKPGMAGWQKATQDSCQRPGILNRYGNDCPSIGIVTGEPSFGLCSIDFDTGESLAEFRRHNPWVSETLITRGARGANVWIRISDPCPRLARIKWKGKACGELRGTGGYTIVWGVHPSGNRYTANANLPLPLRYEQITWPEGFQIAKPFPSTGKDPGHPETNPQPSAESSASLQLYVSASLHDSTPVQSCEASPMPSPQEIPSSADPHTVTPEQILEHQRIAQEASSQFQTTNPKAALLYARYMENHYEAQPHERNAVIVKAVPFLYRAISETYIPELLRHFWRCHHPLFRATEPEHMSEVAAMIDAVRTTFLNELSPAERQLYQTEEQRVQATYRICRDLAALGKVAPGAFFMSAGDLAIRLGVDSQQAYRALRRLCALGILRVEVPGEPRAKGVSGLATTYRWMLPLPKPTTQAAEAAHTH